ncbi:MAG: UDP-N-acetylglucosamine 2-epimerase (non-hydrolyzing) [bacterium (Candidatus Stahlbacteria) CG08_land_8_20_14_0_20_40_26]|nr:MAG: UDP-N-acetylglucosamine 2-epimerase (non-hydrolyzing) [bacterium (Candidatus Stahlbacteria) CG23_combo_of_CG06-09_8_20_14_all_40_9]PIS24720.1 MAG: UDP-N-acetylglucosamine 2-epimerase (non-hydrolyzing) [bacterium (Candidatus Stahlbacteria) CG08_land_8_20_14_0_20_40_26]
MQKIAIVIGTRPDAIKLAPLVNVMKKDRSFKTILIATAQHRWLLDQVLSVFSLSPDHDFNIMIDGQDLFHISTQALTQFKTAYKNLSPDMVIVQGDTTTTFIAALSAFYEGIPVAHVEAGLRSFDKCNPYPEEINRILTDNLSTLLFAPTKKARENLLREGITENIYVTGNTAIDAIERAIGQLKENPVTVQDKGSKLILVTCHRRESFGEPIREICYALKDIVENFQDVEIVYPLHPNPNIRLPVNDILKSVERISIIDPPPYLEFINLMSSSYLVLTDSGGLQEEAPSLNKPVLVMRKVTERTEGIEAGTATLVGTNREKIVESVSRLLKNKALYNSMSGKKNPYGDGKASQRIHAYIRKYFNLPCEEIPEFSP